jgi:hypothetical protein
MLTDEAQNLTASENYVALHANPAADTPYVDGRFSLYPDGEAPEYFDGADPYDFRARGDYGRIYFYLGAMRYGVWGTSRFYGLCTEDGMIVTEPVYTVALLLTDSNGNKAYFCHKGDREPLREMVSEGDWSHEVSHYPALLFAVDGSWIKEFDSAELYYGVTGPANAIMNADVLAVMLGGKWGAVNMKGETVIPFNRDSYEGIYPPFDGRTLSFSVTGDRFMRNTGVDETGKTLYDLCDGSGNLIATGLRGMPQGMAGEFIVTSEWGEQSITVFTYTLDGELIASLAPTEGSYSEARPLGDYVWIYAENSILICDRWLNILYEFSRENNGEAGMYRGLLLPGPNVLYRSYYTTLFHRTYLPDGTRLMTWYDPEMSY